MNIDEIKADLATFQDWDFNGGIAEEAIQRASSATRLAFPPQFIVFLRQLGAGYVSSEEFIGLGGPQHLDVTWITDELRNRMSSTKFPFSMIPIRNDGYGNYDCIDTSNPTNDGEFQIVVWQHDGGNNQDYQILANSYFDWMQYILNEIRLLDAEDA